MELLKELRAAKKVSQQIVANYLGITRQAYSNYENGNRDPDNETLLKLAEYFDVSTDYLLRGTKNASASSGSGPSDDDLKFALFGGTASDAQFEEVKRFARFIKERDDNGSSATGK